MKVQISVADELMKRIDDYAEKTYMSRSGLIGLACTSYLAQHEALMALNDISLSIRKMAETGVLDSGTERRIKDFEMLVKMMTGK